MEHQIAEQSYEEYHSYDYVRVVVRCRPLNVKETREGHSRIVEISQDGRVIEIRNPNATATEPPKSFKFEKVYDWNSRQRDLYDETFRDLVQSVIRGFNGTILAYGQTGAGKKFTLHGSMSDPEIRGVMPKSFEHIFQHISHSQNQHYLIRASYLKLYNEEIRDLLSKDHQNCCRQRELKERPDTGVFVKDLSSLVVKSVKELEDIMKTGNYNHLLESTFMGERGSRSSLIFTITIESKELKRDGETPVHTGKLNFVVTAGNERRKPQFSSASTQRLKEAKKMNMSMSALGNVIFALSDSHGSNIIPYRDSKLTRLLKASLGGNARTVMVANIGPSGQCFEETKTTLRYANYAKTIRNKPKVNIEPIGTLLQQFLDKINRLKEMLTADVGPEQKIKRTSKNEDNDDDTVEKMDDDSGGEKSEEQNQSLLSQTTIVQDKDGHLVETQDQESARKELQTRQALVNKIKVIESQVLKGEHFDAQQKRRLADVPYEEEENVGMMQLDIPNRTTMDSDEPQVAPQVQAALDAALQMFK